MTNLSRIEALSQAADFIKEHVAGKANGYVRDDMTGDKRWQLIVQAAEFLLQDGISTSNLQVWKDELVSDLTKIAATNERSWGDDFCEGFQECLQHVSNARIT